VCVCLCINSRAYFDHLSPLYPEEEEEQMLQPPLSLLQQRATLLESLLPLYVIIIIMVAVGILIRPFCLAPSLPPGGISYQSKGKGRKGMIALLGYLITGGLMSILLLLLLVLEPLLPPLLHLSVVPPLPLPLIVMRTC
jgi:hypothetical protein